MKFHTTTGVQFHNHMGQCDHLVTMHCMIANESDITHMKKKHVQPEGQKGTITYGTVAQMDRLCVMQYAPRAPYKSTYHECNNGMCRK